jgi:hypothetical protein
MSPRRPLVLGLVLGLVLASSSCREGYDNNDAELAVRQKAKETCSCLFVMKRDEAWCGAYTKVTPDVAKAEIDYERKRVTAVALGFFRANASFRAGRGCALED